MNSGKGWGSGVVRSWWLSTGACAGQYPLAGKVVLPPSRCAGASGRRTLLSGYYARAGNSTNSGKAVLSSELQDHCPVAVAVAFDVDGDGE